MFANTTPLYLSHRPTISGSSMLGVSIPPIPIRYLLGTRSRFRASWIPTVPSLLTRFWLLFTASSLTRQSTFSNASLLFAPRIIIASTTAFPSSATFAKWLDARLQWRLATYVWNTALFHASNVLYTATNPIAMKQDFHAGHGTLTAKDYRTSYHVEAAWTVRFGIDQWLAELRLLPDSVGEIARQVSA